MAVGRQPQCFGRSPPCVVVQSLSSSPFPFLTLPSSLESMSSYGGAHAPRMGFRDSFLNLIATLRLPWALPSSQRRIPDQLIRRKDTDGSPQSLLLPALTPFRVRSISISPTGSPYPPSRPAQNENGACLHTTRGTPFSQNVHPSTTSQHLRLSSSRLQGRPCPTSPRSTLRASTSSREVSPFPSNYSSPAADQLPPQHAAKCRKTDLLIRLIRSGSSPVGGLQS